VAADAAPEAFGLTTWSVSWCFVRARATARHTLHERRHDDAEWLVLLLDGQSFADDQVVIALAVTTTREKRIPGLAQTATEHKRGCAAFLRGLVERGVQASGRRPRRHADPASPEVFANLGISVKTTNLIESIMARIEAATHRITRRRTSDQNQRWSAAALLETEKQIRKVKGHQHLTLLRAALRGTPCSSLAAA